MSTSVTLPALGESVTEGTVTRWLKQVGDTVEADEPLLEVSTDKVDTEIPSPTAGVLLEIKAHEDETVEVGAELAIIGEAGEAPSESSDSGGAEATGADLEAGGADQGTEQSTATAPEPDAEDDRDSSVPALDEEQPAPKAEAKPAAGNGTEVTLPALGESVTEGTVTRWLKKVGDAVETDDPLLEVSTDKVDTEIPSPTAGTLLEIRVQEDETVEVGSVLAVIGEESAASGDGGSGGDSGADTEPEPKPQPEPEPEPKPEPEPEAGPEAEPDPEPLSEPAVRANNQKAAASTSAPTPSREPSPAPANAPAPTSPTERSATSDGDATYVTPLVRKLAAEHGVDLGSVQGTGVGGRVRKQDVLAAADAARAAAEAAQAAPAPAAESAPATAQAAATPVEASSLRGSTEKMSRLRKTIAKRMVESLQVSAQLTTVVEVDLTRVSRLRAKVKDDFLAREGVKLSYLPFLVKASVEALKVHPKVNSTVDSEAGEITYPATENVAIAVDTEKGLIVPVIRDAGDLSIAGIAKKIADLANRTRTNKLSPDDLVGGTFTITNTGSRGALFDTPIINQPQVAILGTGALVKRAVVMSDPDLGETIAVRDMMYLALSYDHRVVDGADAARFLSTLKERLEGGDFGSEFGL